MDSQNILVVFEMVPEDVACYKVPVSHPMADTIRQCAGKYINTDQTNEAINIFNDWAAEDGNQFKVSSKEKYHITGITEVVICGFIL